VGAHRYARRTDVSFAGFTARGQVAFRGRQVAQLDRAVDDSAVPGGTSWQRPRPCHCGTTSELAAPEQRGGFDHGLVDPVGRSATASGVHAQVGRGGGPGDTLERFWI
jgi:hypothetical protein